MAHPTPDAANRHERVRISCPGCGRNNHVLWPRDQAHLEYRCFNCHKSSTLHRGGKH